MSEPFIVIREGSQPANLAPHDGDPPPPALPGHAKPRTMPESSPSYPYRGPRPVSIEDCSDEDDDVVATTNPSFNVGGQNGGNDPSITRTPRPPSSYKPPKIATSPGVVYQHPASNDGVASGPPFNSSPYQPAPGSDIGPIDGEPHVPFNRDSPTSSAGRGRRFSVRSNRGPNPGGVPASPAGLSNLSMSSSHQSDVFSEDSGQATPFDSWPPEHAMQGHSPYLQYASPISAHLQSPEAFPSPWPSSGPASSPPTQPQFPSQPPSRVALPPAMPRRDTRDLDRPSPLISGYHKLSLHLTGEIDSPRCFPIYRRFEALNHRLLLQIQDELAVLETEMKSLDRADAQARTVRDRILPASRRSELRNPRERGHDRVDLMSRIATKLEQYRQVLATFKDMQQYPRPTTDEIDGYKTLLFREDLIVSSETKFLDDQRDLLCLPLYETENPQEDEAPSPQTNKPMLPPLGFFSNQNSNSTTANINEALKSVPDSSKLKKMAYLRSRTLINSTYTAIIAVLVPILTFYIVPSFFGRLAIVLVSLGGIAAVMVSTGVLRGSDQNVIREYIMCAGVYGGLMAVLAAVVR